MSHQLRVIVLELFYLEVVLDEYEETNETRASFAETTLFAKNRRSRPARNNRWFTSEHAHHHSTKLDRNSIDTREHRKEGNGCRTTLSIALENDVDVRLCMISCKNSLQVHFNSLQAARWATHRKNQNS